MDNIAIFGRKAFFFSVDSALIPESYMGDLCDLGYEAHLIGSGDGCSLQDKVEIILKNYPGSALFFNIDANVQGVDWKSYIKTLCQNHKSDAVVGVVHKASATKKDDESLSNYYLRDVGVGAGFLALSEHSKENFTLIIEQLKKIGAKGRRNNIRVVTPHSNIVFSADNIHFDSKIEDVNISHFRCTFTDKKLELKIFEKVRDAKFDVEGLKFTSDAVLIMKRVKDNLQTCVFLFIHDKIEDLPELDDATKTLMNKKIYSMVSRERMDILQNEFRHAGR